MLDYSLDQLRTSPWHPVCTAMSCRRGLSPPELKPHCVLLSQALVGARAQMRCARRDTNWMNPSPAYAFFGVASPWDQHPAQLTTESGQLLLDR